ncbi:MAG: RNA methyltransferase [Proteobacteria bacterium]|nr:MAG: RNA methyltransferase [Pseudomonadota bacterium]QKK11860.1 MAG: RNA methyltransferase [Pseudomonadota bacterium]
MLENIEIVLVGTTHPGNIGSAARAMKNMDLKCLTLVAPERFPSAEATARASGADDLLAQARVCADLDEALSDCTLVMATSARLRTIPWPALEPREAATMLWRGAQEGRVAVLFGREHSGLSNQELERCAHLIHIPTSEHFSSLNLGAAVQVIAYELKLASSEARVPVPERDSPLARDEEIQGLYQHMEEALVEIGFLHPEAPKQLMRRLKRLFNRIDLEQTEVNLLRGILKAAQRQARRHE